MKIGIDVRFYGEAGPGRYASELLKNLEAIEKENDYVVYLRRSNFDSYQPRNPRFRKVMADFHWYTLAEQTQFLEILNRENFDLVHFTQINTPLFYVRPFVVTIHDLILHEFSTERGGLLSRLIYRFKKLPYHLVFLKDVYASRAIFVPSLTTKSDLLSFYKVRKDKIYVTYESVDHYPSSKVVFGRSDVLDKYGIRRPYLLSLGSFYPHKNIRGLVEAFKILKEKYNFPGQLVLVGKESFFSHEIRNFILENRINDIIFPGLIDSGGYISDAAAEALYAQAFIYVQPALKEGFGFPPIEAMAFGVPTAVSDIPSFREMCGEAAYYFDPRHEGEIASAINDLLTNEALRINLIEKGRENIQRFSWRRMAEETMAVYKKVMNNARD